MSNLSVLRVTDLDSLIDAAATRFAKVISRLQTEKDRVVNVVLTGGSAGIGTLRALRQHADEIDWARVHIFFGDERNVAVDHPDSNEGQAREALLNHIDIPSENIHGYNLDQLTMEESVAHYKKVLEEYAPDGFDLHLLGMGGEGHINTIFPHTEVVEESSELVMAEYDSPKPPAERVTLTLPAVHRATRVWLLVSGAEKAEAARAVIDGADPKQWPAAGAHGRVETLLFLDDAAALN